MHYYRYQIIRRWHGGCWAHTRHGWIPVTEFEFSRRYTWNLFKVRAWESYTTRETMRFRAAVCSALFAVGIVGGWIVRGMV